jgi:pilus assembly protein CpaF
LQQSLPAPGILKLLELLVRGRFNILVSGGTGSGKTTLLNLISTQIPEGERIITIEDAAELQLRQEHVVSMETRPAIDGVKTEVNQRMLVRNALRMRPDRIIIGEVRGVEALDMLQAMNTGHDGSLTTIHSNSPRDAISRLELMMLYGGISLPHNAMIRMITAAIHVIVQLKRYSDGVRRISQLTEITGMEGDIVTLHDIAYFKEEGFDTSGQVRGKFIMSHMQPNFLEKLHAKGLV